MGRNHPSKSRSVSASQPVTAKELQEVEEIEKKVLKSPSPKKKSVPSSSPESSNKSKSKNEDEAVSKEKGELRDEIPAQDLEKGMNLLVAMSDEDFQTLLGRIDSQSPKMDKIKAKIRNGRLDWDKIAFGMYAPRECCLIWQFLLSNARRYRIMSEIVQEIRLSVKHNPKYVSTISNCPQQPPEARGGYQVYIRELWKIHTAECDAKKQKHMNWCQFYKVSHDGYEQLTEKQKEHYVKESKKENEKYQLQRQAYLKEHPHLIKPTKNDSVPKVKREKASVEKKRKPATVKEYPDAPIPPVPPHAYFIQSKLQKLETPPTAEELPGLKSKFQLKYAKLSDKKKAKWIDYTINYCQNYTTEVEMFQFANPSYRPRALKIRSVVKKSDIVIWEKYRDKPQRPKTSVFSLFLEDFCKKEENADMPIEDQRREADNAFKELDWYHRETYKINFKLSSMKYRKDIAEYFHNLPDVVKPLVIDTIPKIYRSGLLDVGKFPAVDEDLYKEEFGEFTEEEPSPKKKNKKRRHDELSDPDDLTSPTPSIKNNLDGESEEIVSDASGSRRKKKKRKDRFANFQTSQRPEEDDHEVIISDLNIEDDEERIKIEPYPIEVTPLPRFSPRRDLSKLKPVTQEEPVLSNTTVVPKPPASNFVPHKVGQQDIDDAIRGIFDGRAHFGRRFSVYYYYAKYVSQDKNWIAHTGLFGILETADKIVAAFIKLSDKQKDIFIAQSYNFYLQKRYGITMKGTKKIYEPDEVNGYRFPGEPRPPARTAAKLYQKEVEYLIRKNVSLDFPKWDDLHVDTQMIFVKKLYRETQLYMKKYEEFVMNMAPNDMVEYVLFRAKNWENKYLKESSVTASVKGFIFPLPRNGKEGDGYESCPDVMDDNVPGVTAGHRVSLRQKRHQKLNPFAVERPGFDSVSNRNKSQVQIGAEAGEDADESTYVSSEDETMTPAMNYAKDQTNMRHLNEVKDYLFPMGVLTKKMLSPTKIKKRLSKVEMERMRKAQEALAASRRMKMPKGKEARILFKNRIKTIGFARNQKKRAKVMLPKQRNFNDGEDENANAAAQKKKAKILLPQRPGCENIDLEESDNDSETGGADGGANADEANLDCSEFVRSLQSPKKRVDLEAVPVSEYLVSWDEELDQTSVPYEGLDEVVLEPFNAYARDIEQETENAESFAGPVFDISEIKILSMECGILCNCLVGFGAFLFIFIFRNYCMAIYFIVSIVVYGCSIQMK